MFMAIKERFYLIPKVRFIFNNRLICLEVCLIALTTNAVKTTEFLGHSITTFSTMENLWPILCLNNVLMIHFTVPSLKNPLNLNKAFGLDQEKWYFPILKTPNNEVSHGPSLLTPGQHFMCAPISLFLISIDVLPLLLLACTFWIFCSYWICCHDFYFYPVFALQSSYYLCHGWHWRSSETHFCSAR